MKKKKVGAVIAIKPNHCNYGTALQGLASILAIEKMGHEVRMIRYKKSRTISEIVRTTIGLLRTGYFNLLTDKSNHKKYKKAHPDYDALQNQRIKATNDFKHKYFDPRSDYYTGYKDLCQGSKHYDTVFVGSDQVWTPMSLYARYFNLLFVDSSVPTFSFASSFGVNDIPKFQRKETKKYLEKIDNISVREIRAKEIVESLSDATPEVVADPTMTLTKAEWCDLIKEKEDKIKGKFIFAYLLGERKDIREEVTKISQMTGLPIVNIPHMDRHINAEDGFGDINIWDADALDFVKLIKDAEYICTDSFHGTVFSIIMNKQFLTFYRKHTSEFGSTNSRIDSLLKILNLTDRLSDNDSKGQITKPIDYDAVNEKLDTFRKDTLDFVRKSIEFSK